VQVGSAEVKHMAVNNNNEYMYVDNMQKKVLGCASPDCRKNCSLSVWQTSPQLAMKPGCRQAASSRRSHWRLRSCLACIDLEVKMSRSLVIKCAATYQAFI